MAKQQPVPQLRTAGGIRYELTRKRVKNLNIRVREDGTVAVSIPLRTSAEAADRFVAARAAWVQQAQARFPDLRGEVVAIDNDFFGHTIDVAGLLTGQDISAQLRGRDLGDRVLIPIHMMRHGETVFLDDYTVERLSRELGVPVQVVDEDGFALVDAMFAAE